VHGLSGYNSPAQTGLLVLDCFPKTAWPLLAIKALAEKV
jgi:hypothetical protein